MADPDQNLSAANRKTVGREKLESMTRAGIGKRFHQRSLDEFGELGAGFRKRMAVDLFAQFSEGLNLFVHGKSSYDFCLIMSRAFVIVGHFPRVVSLTTLGEMIEERRFEKLEELRDAKTLVVTGVCDTGERPFTPWLGRRIENLIAARLDDNLPTVLQTAENPVLSWYSKPFSARFFAAAELIEVRP